MRKRNSPARKTLEQLIREGGVCQRNVLRAAIAELAEVHRPGLSEYLLLKRWRSYLHLRGPGDRQ